MTFAVFLQTSNYCRGAGTRTAIAVEQGSPAATAHDAVAAAGSTERPMVGGAVGEVRVEEGAERGRRRGSDVQGEQRYHGKR